ncbi:hypothetical protein ABFX02_10G050900 [Erythranthe guttata]
MKNIAICYNEHAIKVSDSYCSGGGSSKQGNSSHSIAPSIQNAVTCIYKVDQYTAKKKKKQYFLIRLTWCNTLLKKGFSIAVCENAFSAFSKTFTVVRKEYGQETFESSSLIMDVFWDLRVAKYGSGPEPVAGFYVVVLANSEVSLILGDMEQEILEIKKRVLETRVSRFTLVSRIERFSGTNNHKNNNNNYTGVYATRAKFSETGNWHEILIKCTGNNYQDMEMCVCIDKKSVIEVKRLGWNFRGNGTVFVDGLLVDFMWNVHDWLFSPTTTTKGYAVFLFRTRKGADSRLWLEEKINFDEKQLINDEHEEKVGFSFLICASKNNPD